MSHDSDLSSFFISETIFNNANNTLLKTLTISSFTYRAISFPSFTYKSYKKPYLTIADLHMRYNSLNKPSFNKVTRIIIMLSIIFMQNLYENFYDKKKRVSFTSNKTLNSPIKQYTTRQNLEHVVFERFEFIRNLSESTPRLHFSITQKLAIQ